MTGQIKRKVPEIKITYQMSCENDFERDIKASLDAYDAFMSRWDNDKVEDETHFGILYVGEDSKAIGMHSFNMKAGFRGMRDLYTAFTLAVHTSTKSIYIASSGPSKTEFIREGDFMLKEWFKLAGEKVDIEVVDHLVIRKNGFASVRMHEELRKRRF